jgi:hypothetical protein
VQLYGYLLGTRFFLKDYGISSKEEFVISSGQVGINKVNWGAEVTLIFIK